MGGRHHLLGHNHDASSLLRNVDGRVKTAIVLTALVANLATESPYVSISLLVTAAMLILFAGVPPASFMKRMAVPVLLSAVALLSQLFWVRTGSELLALPWPGEGLVIFSEGIAKGALLAARILGGTTMLLFLSLTTPLPELLRAARFFRVPAVLAELGTVMYRYIFLLLEEGARIHTAQRARRGFATFRTALRSSATLGGMLVLRTYDRAERSFAAMRCRGYRGSLVHSATEPMRRRDWAILLLSEVALIGLCLLP